MERPTDEPTPRPATQLVRRRELMRLELAAREAGEAVAERRSERERARWNLLTEPNEETAAAYANAAVAMRDYLAEEVPAQDLEELCSHEPGGDELYGAGLVAGTLLDWKELALGGRDAFRSLVERYAECVVLTSSIEAGLGDPPSEEQWRARHETGAEAEEALRGWYAARNDLAQELHIGDGLDLALRVAGIDRKAFEERLDAVERATRVFYRENRAKEDAEIAEEHDVAEEALRPWHYPDPRLVVPSKDDVLPAPDTSGDGSEGRTVEEIVERAISFFDGIAMNARPVIEGSQLLERPQLLRAHCVEIDAPNDVRISVGVGDTGRALRRLVEQLAEGLATRYASSTLPPPVRGRITTWLRVATARTVGDLVYGPVFLYGYAGRPTFRAEKLGGLLAHQARLDAAYRVRWALARYRFERGMVADPARADASELWWSARAGDQLLHAPEATEGDWVTWNATFDRWSAIDLVAELAHAELSELVEEELGQTSRVDSVAFGELIIDRIFRYGRSRGGSAIMQEVTGAAPGTAAFARRFASR